MRTLPICFLSFVLTLLVYGCFGSRERGDDIDSGFDGGDVAIEAGGTDSRDTSRAGSGALVVARAHDSDATGGIRRVERNSYESERAGR
jgi:hypothetical protein